MTMHTNIVFIDFVDYYKNSDEISKSIIEICAVADGIFNIERVTSLYNAWQKKAAKLTREKTQSYFQKMHAAKLFREQRFACSACRNYILRQLTASGTLGGLADLTKDKYPRHAPQIDYRESEARIRRDYRLAIYQSDKVEYAATKRDAKNHWTGIIYQEVFYDLFDEEIGFFTNIFNGITPEIQDQLALEIFLTACANGYGIDQKIAEISLKKIATDKFYMVPEYLGLHHIYSGRLDEAKKIQHGSTDLQYISGFIAMMSGKVNDAALHFEKSNAAARKSNSFAWESTPSLFKFLRLLMLLKSFEAGVEKIGPYKISGNKIVSLLEKEFMSGHGRQFYWSMNALARLIIWREQTSANELNERLVAAKKPLECFFWAALAHWSNLTLSKDAEKAVVSINLKLLNPFWRWQYIAILNALGIKTNEKADDMFDNLTPIVDIFTIKPTWQRHLDALINLATPEPIKQNQGSEGRLLWRLSLSYGEVIATPYLQTILKSGRWASGTKLSYIKAADLAHNDLVSNKDKSIINSYDQRYGFSLPAPISAILAMVGHEHIFSEEDSKPLKVVQHQPQMLVLQKKSGFLVQFDFSPEVRLYDSSFIDPGFDGEIRVGVLSKANQQAINIIGRNGIELPTKAEESLKKSLGNLAQTFSIQSDIEIGNSLPSLDGDPSPVIVLRPDGDTLRGKISVMPHESLKMSVIPGRGAPRLITEVDSAKRQVIRDLDQEKIQLVRLKQRVPLLSELASDDHTFAALDLYSCLELLETLEPLVKEGSTKVLWPEGGAIDVKKISSESISIKVASKGAWFEVSSRVQIDDSLVLELRELLQLVGEAKGRFLNLGFNRFIAITDDLRKKLERAAAVTNFKGETLTLPKSAVLVWQDLLEDQNSGDTCKQWQELTTKINNLKNLKIPAPKVQAELRDYQIDGYRWMYQFRHIGLGVCLADDMGLGKTLQTIALLSRTANDGLSLVVCPTSVVRNWETEISRFAPQLNCQRFDLIEDRQAIKKLGKNTVLLVTYGLLVRETSLFSEMEFANLVLDEAHAIKNKDTQRAKIVNQLNAHFKIALTGTPIENHIGEIWSLFNFINPGLLGNYRHFEKTYINDALGTSEVRSAKHQKLKAVIKPFIMRRLKQDVLDELPEKTYIIEKCEPEPEEVAFYEAIRQEALQQLGGIDNRFQVLAAITKLRRAACHPSLVNDNPEALSILSSAKHQRATELISNIVANNHRVLVFSQFLDNLSLVSKALNDLDIAHHYLDGSMSQAKRSQVIEEFQNGDKPVFLISLKAGGVGINLTAADYVIHLDPWWNPAVEDQATDRAHRIGQKRSVTVYRLISVGTIEEKILDLHAQKRGISDDILADTDKGSALSVEELLSMLQP